MSSKPIEVNLAPWASIPPASRINVARDAGVKLFNGKTRANLQKIEDEIGQLAVDRDRLCSPAAYDEAETRIRELAHLSGSERAEKLADVTAKRAQIPIFERELDSEIRKRCEEMAPAALQVLREILVRVQSEIAGLKPSERGSEYWGLKGVETLDWLRHPLQRLESIVTGNIEDLSRHASTNLWMVRPTLADANVIQLKSAAHRTGMYF